MIANPHLRHPGKAPWDGPACADVQSYVTVVVNKSRNIVFWVGLVSLVAGRVPERERTSFGNELARR